MSLRNAGVGGDVCSHERRRASFCCNPVFRRRVRRRLPFTHAFYLKKNNLSLRRSEHSKDYCSKKYSKNAKTLCVLRFLWPFFFPETVDAQL